MTIPRLPPTFEAMDYLRSMIGTTELLTPKVVEQMKLSIRDEMAQDRLLIEHVAQTTRLGYAAPVTTVTGVLGERAQWVASLCLDDDVWAPEPRLCLDIETRVKLAIAIRSAVPYLWKKEPYAVARDLEVPPHIIARGDILPHPFMWWSYEVAYTGMQTFDEEGHDNTDELGFDVRGMDLDATFVMDVGTGSQIVDLGMNEKGGWFWASPYSFPYGAKWPDDFPASHERMAIGRVLSMLSFLNSPYIPKEQSHVSRRMRRTLRLADDEGSEEVTFVDLRATAKHKHEESEQHHDVEWKNRWVVRGHHRAQWYPSLQAHKLIYVAPYIKGPEDMPLKQPAYRVIR